ncbi:MAG: hypothetical protein KAX20_04885 [Candidatus Omnitrophica bacterium]|nr:hypothetical protein [Candidatus Omnitrophota bacterium]
MKLTRTEAGKNNFRLDGLTVGTLVAIRRGLEELLNDNYLGPVGTDVYEQLTTWSVDKIDPTGDSFLEGK